MTSWGVDKRLADEMRRFEEAAAKEKETLIFDALEPVKETKHEAEHVADETEKGFSEIVEWAKGLPEAIRERLAKILSKQ